MFGPVFQFPEGLFPVFCLAGACAGGGVHPLEFAAQKVPHLVGLGVPVGDAFGAFLEIVRVVALIDVDLPVVEFHHDVAHPVEEVTVVGDHEEGAARPSQVVLEVFDGVDVEMVGGLVKDQEVGFGGEDLRDGHALDLAAGEFLHPLVGPQAELGEQPDDAVLVFEAAGVVQMRQEQGASGPYLFEQRCFGVVGVVLLQECDADFFQELDLAAGVGLVLSGQDAHQRGLTGSVRCDQGDLVTLVHVEADMVEQHFRTVRLGDVLYLQVGRHQYTKL